MTPSRRNFLKGAVSGAAGTALAGGVLIGGAHADADAATTGDTIAEAAAYPFHGPNQAGILAPTPAGKQAASIVAAFDVVGTSRTELTALLQTLTSLARTLTTGGPMPTLGISAPPADSDVLGPSMPADGLTITVGFGSSLFDERFGLASQKPLKLTGMTAFPNDALEAAWTGGDLSLQICANHADAVHHALRLIAKHTRGWMQPRWKMQGYASPPRPSGTPRNLLGFKDGTANPTGPWPPSWSGWTIPPSPPGRRAAPTRWSG